MSGSLLYFILCFQVKYYGAEEYEINRYREAIVSYQVL